MSQNLGVLGRHLDSAGQMLLFLGQNSHSLGNLKKRIIL